MISTLIQYYTHELQGMDIPKLMDLGNASPEFQAGYIISHMALGSPPEK